MATSHYHISDFVDVKAVQKQTANFINRLKALGIMYDFFGIKENSRFGKYVMRGMCSRYEKSIKKLVK